MRVLRSAAPTRPGTAPAAPRDLAREVSPPALPGHSTRTQRAARTGPTVHSAPATRYPSGPDDAHNAGGADGLPLHVRPPVTTADEGGSGVRRPARPPVLGRDPAAVARPARAGVRPAPRRLPPGPVPARPAGGRPLRPGPVRAGPVRARARTPEGRYAPGGTGDAAVRGAPRYAAPGTQPHAPPGAPPQGGFAWRDGAGPPPPPPRRVSGLLIALLAIAALLAAGVAAYFLVPRLTATAAPPPSAAPVAERTGGRPGGAALRAAERADDHRDRRLRLPPSRDASGAVVDYGPERMVDGRADTAWRCDGNGDGQDHQGHVQQPGARRRGRA